MSKRSGRETKGIELGEDLAALEQPDNNAFTVQGRHGGDTQIDVLAGQPCFNAAILRQAPLGNVELGEDLET